MLKMVKLSYGDLCLLLKGKTNDLMGEYRKFTNDLIPPVRLEYIADIRNCKLSPADSMNEKLEAMLIPQANGSFIIRYSNRFSPERQRMSIAHEIGHSFLYGASELSKFPKRVYSSTSELDLERACFYAGRQILLPDYYLDPMLESIYQDFDVKRFSNLIEEIRSIFKVSWNVAVRRILKDKDIGHNLGVLTCNIDFNYFQYNLFQNKDTKNILITKPEPIWGNNFKNKSLRVKVTGLTSNIILKAIKEGKYEQSFQLGDIFLDTIIKRLFDNILIIYIQKR